MNWSSTNSQSSLAQCWRTYRHVPYSHPVTAQWLYYVDGFLTHLRTQSDHKHSRTTEIPLSRKSVADHSAVVPQDPANPDRCLPGTSDPVMRGVLSTQEPAFSNFLSLWESNFYLALQFQVLEMNLAGGFTLAVSLIDFWKSIVRDVSLKCYGLFKVKTDWPVILYSLA